MADIDQLAERHIQQYESQLKHLDDVIARAQEQGSNAEGLRAELKELADHRGELADYIAELKDMEPLDWMEEGGPMVHWDAVAERIDELVERIEH